MVAASLVLYIDRIVTSCVYMWWISLPDQNAFMVDHQRRRMPC